MRKTKNKDEYVIAREILFDTIMRTKKIGEKEAEKEIGNAVKEYLSVSNVNEAIVNVYGLVTSYIRYPELSLEDRFAFTDGLLYARKMFQKYEKMLDVFTVNEQLQYLLSTEKVEALYNKRDNNNYIYDGILIGVKESSNLKDEKNDIIGK